MNRIQELQKKNKRNTFIVLAMAIALAALGIGCLFVGSSNLTFREAMSAFAGKGTPSQTRIIWNIRVPRVLAAIIAGAGLSIFGLIMQTTLKTPRHRPLL